jgi:hypothetical protein
MKLNEIQTYKNFGTIQMSKDEDGKTIYLYTHSFFGDNGYTNDENTIKGAREMLDYYEAKAQKIKEAIRTLRGSGYKVFKELA